VDESLVVPELEIEKDLSPVETDPEAKEDKPEETTDETVKGLLIPRIVFRNAIKAIKDDVKFRYAFVDMYESVEIDASEAIEEVLDSIRADFPRIDIEQLAVEFDETDATPIVVDETPMQEAKNTPYMDLLILIDTERNAEMVDVNRVNTLFAKAALLKAQDIGTYNLTQIYILAILPSFLSIMIRKELRLFITVHNELLTIRQSSSQSISSLKNLFSV
jgi:hypothetical protein